MKTTILLFTLLFSLCAVDVYSQRFAGTVIEVIDGQHFVIDAGRSLKMKVRLQYIDPPEASQPLHAVVKGHLSNMILNKPVSLTVTQSTADHIAISRVYVNEVDVSMQMLRDGAAWYSVPEMKFQSEADRKEYLEAERALLRLKNAVFGV